MGGGWLIRLYQIMLDVKYAAMFNCGAIPVRYGHMVQYCVKPCNGDLSIENDECRLF